MSDQIGEQPEDYQRTPRAERDPLIVHGMTSADRAWLVTIVTLVVCLWGGIGLMIWRSM